MATQSPRVKVSQEQIDATLLAFEKLPEPVAKARLFSKMEAVQGMRTEIQALLKKGYLLEDVVRAMAGTGIDITTSALKSYMSRTVTKTSKKAVMKKIVKAPTGQSLSGSSSSRSPSPSSDSTTSTPHPADQDRPAGSGRFEVKKDVV